jgi:hypothetical protein
VGVRAPLVGVRAPLATVRAPVEGVRGIRIRVKLRLRAARKVTRIGQRGLTRGW